MSLKISLRLEKLMKEARVTLANMSKHSSNSYEKFQEFCKKIGKRKEVIIMETENELDSLIKVQLDTLNISMSNLNNIKYFN
jgi:3-deoxy-D-manno-octulosonic-acid transferase